MAIITDPDNLNDSVADDSSTEVYIDVTNFLIKLNIVGNLSTDGVTLKALYSFLKEEWLNDPNSKGLNALPFPMVPITDESFEFVDGWNFDADASRYLIRTAGWTVKNTSSNVIEKWAGIIGLGTIESDDQLYFNQGNGAVDVELTGQVNQAVQIFRDDDGDGNTSEGSDFDRRTTFTIFCREQGQTYDSASISDIGVTTMDSIAYRFPISTGTDLKIDATDNTIETTEPYTGMSITYYATPQSRDIGGTSYNFGVIIDGYEGTAEEIYEFVQYKLRQNSDINEEATEVIGKTADSLLQFVGDNLSTLSVTNPAGGGTGVFIDNYQVVDINRLTFTDNTETERTFPFVAALTINFGDNLVNDAAAKYWIYFTTTPDGYDFGEADGLLVQDGDDADMTGDIDGNSSIQKSFAYDTNEQGGRTAGTNANITAVGIGLSTGQYVKATGTIARSTSNVVSLVAALERNYLNE